MITHEVVKGAFGGGSGCRHGGTRRESGSGFAWPL